MFRCTDLNADGDYTDAGEITDFYDEVIGALLDIQNPVSIETDDSGKVYLADTGPDMIYLLQDLDGDGNAHGAGEATIYFDGDPLNNAAGIAMPTPNGVHLDGTGTVWVANASTNSVPGDTIVKLQDLNDDGDANDAGEAVIYYDSIPAARTATRSAKTCSSATTAACTTSRWARPA